MSESVLIDNKVAKSGLITIDLEKLAGDYQIYELDIKEFLYMDLLLREKDFRAAMEDHDWSQYQGGILSTYCSSDAIIASWAYMLIVTHVSPYAKHVHIGTVESARDEYYREILSQHDWSQYEGKRILLKGCSKKTMPQSAYAYATRNLQQYVDRLMYGEACSFVPVWRKPKA